MIESIEELMQQMLITALSFWKTYIADEQMLTLVLEETARKLAKPVAATVAAGQVVRQVVELATEKLVPPTPDFL